MNCRYYYGNQKFNSEIELDDFLLDKGPELIEKFGDLVFSERSIEQLNYMDIMNRISIESWDLKKRGGKETYNPNFLKNEAEYKDSYLVTKFLEGLKVEGRLMFPEFIPENYFDHRLEKWRDGEFSEKELLDFHEEPEFLNGQIPTVLSDELIKRLINIEKAKWQNEADVGTAIHKLCEIFFSRYDFTKEKGKEQNYGIWGDKEDEEILRKFNSAGPIVNDFLSEDKKKETLRYCRELRATIESRYGGGDRNFVYFPEVRLKAAALNPESGDEINLVGTIDLLVIPPKGTPFMIDYKVSPADYWTEAKQDIPIEQLSPTDYSTAKKRAFRYLLATYGRMLRQKNSAFIGMTICVAPILLQNYRKEDDKWKFDTIRTDVSLLDDLTEDPLNKRVEENLDSIFSDISIASMEDKKVLLILLNQLLTWFTKYDSKTGVWSLAEVNELMTNGKTKMEENELAMNEEMRFSYILDGKKIYASSKALLCAKVLSLLNSYTRTIKDKTIGFKNAVKHKDYNTGGYTNRLEHDTGNADFFRDFLKRYVESGEYEVIELGVPEAFDSLGIVLLKNKISKNIEVIKLTTQSITRRFDPTNKNKLITQCFASDIVDKSSTNFLLDAVNGNVELLETMLAINLIPRVFRREMSKVHSILLVNPYINSGLTASNKLLLYAYKTMLRYRKLNEDLGRNNIYYSENTQGTIQFCTAAEQALDTLRTGISIIEENKGLASKTVKTLTNKCLTPLEEDIITKPKPSSELENTLYEAIVEMEELDKSLKTRLLKEIDFSTSQDEMLVLYLALLRAYAEVKGYDFKQLILAYSNLMDSFNIFLEGHSGLRTDNPGTTASDNLNKVTEFIDDCYKRVTDSMLRPHAKSLELVKRLKKSKNISYLGDSTFLNSVRIYDNMTKIQNDGDWVFLNPFDEVNVSLSTEERDFLKYAITKINSNRFRLKGETDEAFEKRLIKNLNAGKIEWLRVPLAYKGTQGKLETQGLLSAAKDYFYSFMPKEVKKRLKLKFSHLLTPEGKQNRDDVYAMRTIFDYGEDPTERMKMLAERRNEYDHDLQSVLLKHLFGYSLRNESEKAFILIKGAYADILNLEFTLSRENAAEKLYLMDNVKIMTGNKIMSDKELLINEYASKIMKLASVFALGFSPKLLYLLLEGIYKDIGIVWRNEDGRFGFTFKEMLTSFADVYKEMGKFGYTPTKLERLNQLYRINDMDINVYAQHLQNSHNLVKNFSSFLFRFASRPDFYNRMTIFESYMRHDGTFDAYLLNKEGELEYLYDKDKRFNLLISGDKSNSEEYYKQESLYIAMAKLFEREGAIYADGTKFKMEKDKNGKWKPLPQAYTNKLARSYKSMADKMYGYYSHEKKALMQSSLVGALFWQMNTYWSGKKNLWFAISSVKDRGNFTHYSEVVLDENGQVVIENGKEKREYFYYLVDESGNIQYDAVPVRYSELKNKNIIVPFYQWEGNFSEGIAVTLTSMLWDVAALGLYNKKDGFVFEPKGSSYSQLFDIAGNLDRSKIILTVRDLYWNNPNENLRTAYRQNIKQFMYDMSVLAIVGGIIGSTIHSGIKEYTKDHKDDHTIKLGLINSSLALSEAIFDSATLDFNPAESIGGRGINWTPFAISLMTRTFKTWSRMITGDTSLVDALLNTFTFNRYTLKPFIKQVKDTNLNNQEKLKE